MKSGEATANAATSLAILRARCALFRAILILDSTIFLVQACNVECLQSHASLHHCITASLRTGSPNWASLRRKPLPRPNWKTLPRASAIPLEKIEQTWKILTAAFVFAAVMLAWPKASTTKARGKIS